MMDFKDQPFLYAAVALAIAGFDAPVLEGAEPAAANEDFECVYSVSEGLDMALVFMPSHGCFVIELQWVQASAATQAAALSLARAVPDLRCTQAADGHTLCLSREVAWDAQVPPEEMAAVVAEMAAAGVELSAAGQGAGQPAGAVDRPPMGLLRG